MHEGNCHIHTKETTDQIEWHKNGRQNGDLAENLIRVASLSDAINGKLCQVIAVGAGKHLFEMPKTSHHCDHVVLYIAKVKADIHTRSDLIVGVAPFCESSQDIGFAAQKLHQTHHILASHAYLPQELIHIIGSRNKDLVIDCVCLSLNSIDNWSKRINDVITGQVSLVQYQNIRGDLH